VISPGGDWEAPAYTLGVGAWYHLALTKSASRRALYVIGQLETQRPLTVSGSVILGDGSLGRWLDPPWNLPLSVPASVPQTPTNHSREP
jgi:hypothetical protein